MTFKYCDVPPVKKLYNYQLVNILVIGSSTECRTTVTNCLITFRMNSMPRADSTISIPPTAATPLPSMLLKKKNKSNTCT